MVNRKITSKQLDLVFHALADGTRRRILQRLTRTDCTVSELAEPFSMSMPAITKHVQVLQRAGLVRKQRSGKFIRCRLNSKQLVAANHWIAEQTAYWDNQLDEFAAFLDQKTHSKGSKS